MSPPLAQHTLPSPLSDPLVEGGTRDELRDEIVLHTSDKSSSRHREDRRPATKRGRYVSKACLNCQKRKVKCSGEQTCRQCRSSELVCIYNHGPKRRKTNPAQTRPDSSTTLQAVATNAPQPSHDQSNISESLHQMMARISSLEREYNTLKDYVANTGEYDQDPAMSGSNYFVDDETSSHTGSHVTDLPGNPDDGFQGASSLLDPITVLNRTVARDSKEHADSRADSPAPSMSATIHFQNLAPRGVNKSIEVLERETRLNGVDSLRRAVDLFFSQLNPHYPCLNENEFRSEFESFLANDNPCQEASADRYQFIALINLIHAETKVLSDEWPDSANAPAWEEFCRAETILNRLIWLGNGDKLTIQCLLIKARYLLYLEKGLAAYDAVGRAVRLCFHLGFHNQSSWTSCSDFEIVMRQRIFWTTFYLERNIAFNNGAPYLIRETECKVDLPKSYDDKLMFPGRPLPRETLDISTSSYLSAAVKWGTLCSEIWDSVFSLNAPKPTSQEFVALTDARIRYSIRQLPTHLQWERVVPTLQSTDRPPYVIRQALILHLRMNQLRLLLRQESILSLTYDAATAEDCVAIASSSINAIHAHFSSESHRRTGRFSSVLYLLVALLPLVCIIVKSENDPSTLSDAIEAFKIGLPMLDQMAPTFGAARHSRRRIHRIIRTAKRAINRFNEPHPMELDANLNSTADYGVNLDAVDSNITDFFSQDLHMPDLEKDKYSHLFDGMMQPPPFSDNDMDAFWLDDQLLGDRWVLPGVTPRGVPG